MEKECRLKALKAWEYHLDQTRMNMTMRWKRKQWMSFVIFSLLLLSLLCFFLSRCCRLSCTYKTLLLYLWKWCIYDCVGINFYYRRFAREELQIVRLTDVFRITFDNFFPLNPRNLIQLFLFFYLQIMFLSCHDNPRIGPSVFLARCTHACHTCLDYQF